MSGRCWYIPFFLVLLPFITGCGERVAEQPPNIVFILVDDLGWTDVGSFGSSFYETPHIDSLTAQGIKFTHAYAASPICSPTRSSILTGKHPARLNQTDWIPGRGNRPDQQLLQVEDLNYLPREEVTIAEMLKDAGYTTAHMGKWHLGGGIHLPEGQGFDVNQAGNRRGSPPSYFYPYKRNGYQLEHLAATGHPGEYLTNRLGEEAAEFIGANSDEPFFLYLSHYAVHTPLEAKEPMVQKYAERADSLAIRDTSVFGREGDHKVREVQSHPVYAAMVESMDESVGTVLEALEANGLSENTVVILFSDNGGLSTSEGWPTANLPLRAGKGWMYEGGIREPMIVRWPGVTEPGSVTDVLVTSVDFFPTLREIAEQPPRPDHTIDGVSLIPLLTGQGSLSGRALHWHYPHYSNQGGTPTGAIRQGDYKLIEFFEDGSVELYNLADDMGEENDLAGKMPEKVQFMRSRLHSWRESVNAQMPEPNPNYEGDTER
jgi:arylsulfatase A-like enzyme